MATQIQLRRGTAAEWTTANPTLAEGEMGIETDTGRFKFGNGINTWTALSYGFASLPAGGGEGQILAKDSTTDYDFVWIDNYTEQVGITVKNMTGSTLTKGTVVYINGSNGGKITIAKAIATSESTSAGTIGMVKENIANSATGVVITSGSVTGINTGSYTAGAPVWLSETTAGTWSATEPSAGNHTVLIGYIENVNSSTGSIFIKTATFPEMNELTGVSLGTLSNNEVLTYESSTGLWKNKPLPTDVVGATNLNELTDVTITGTPTNGQALTYDTATSQWKPTTPAAAGATNLDGLSDVTVTGTPTAGQVLAYDTATSQWIPTTPSSGGATNLDGLSDVTITGTPSDKSILLYDTATSQWKNNLPAGTTVLIGSNSFSGSAPASFTSIPQTYSKLKLIFKLDTVGSLTYTPTAVVGTNVWGTFSKTGSTTAQSAINSALGVGFFGGNTSASVPSGAGISEILISYYTQTAYAKKFEISSMDTVGAARTAAGVSAITTISFSLYGGVWTSATGTVELYGII